MASIQYRMRYGQYDSSVAQQLSIDYLGSVVYSGKTKEIWIDGKCVAANFQGAVDDLNIVIGQLNNLQTTDKTSVINAINSLVSRIDSLDNNVLKTAEITSENGVSSLTIFGKKQTDGLVEDDETKNFVVKIEGEYGESNPLVTKVYVDNEINRVLGSDELEKTLDTIKEIQDELLKEVKYTVIETTGSEITVIEVSRVVDGETGVVTFVDGENNIVATETEDGVEYEVGYSDLNRESAIDSLIANVVENKENIENIENKNVVSGVLVNENKEKAFVTTDSEESVDEFGLKTSDFTIGVKYGTFKTGRGSVLDPESNGYTDGIATVKDVQDYVEERMCWDEFVSNAETLVESINNITGDTYDVQKSVELDDHIVIG